MASGSAPRIHCLLPPPREQSTAIERQDLHRALAEVVADEQRRALHLALATPTQDDDLAARVACGRRGRSRARRDPARRSSSPLTPCG